MAQNLAVLNRSVALSYHTSGPAEKSHGKLQSMLSYSTTDSNRVPQDYTSGAFLLSFILYALLFSLSFFLSFGFSAFRFSSVIISFCILLSLHSFFVIFFLFFLRLFFHSFIATYSNSIKECDPRSEIC